MTKQEINKVLEEYSSQGFNWDQMQEIRKGLENGLTEEQVSMYAKLEFDDMQMQEIRLNLENIGGTVQKKNSIMKAYLVERPAIDWCQDYKMVIIAEDELHAERKARISSDDFKKCKEITVTEIDMNVEQCVLIANTGA